MNVFTYCQFVDTVNGLLGYKHHCQIFGPWRMSAGDEVDIRKSATGQSSYIRKYRTQEWLQEHDNHYSTYRWHVASLIWSKDHIIIHACLAPLLNPLMSWDCNGMEYMHVPTCTMYVQPPGLVCTSVCQPTFVTQATV